MLFSSGGYDDELTFAAAMMAWATNETSFKTAAANFWTQFGFGRVQPYFDWGNKHAGIAVSFFALVLISSQRHLRSNCVT